MKFQIIGIGTLLVAMSAVVAAPFQINEPTGDRWMYPFNMTPGTRGAASTFGAIGEANFDDRDAQVFLRFDTTGVVAAGLGAANYGVNSLRLTMTVNTDESFTYDPTKDALSTYLNPATDADAGRPVELFGAGFRNGQTAATFDESSAFAPPMSAGSGVRNAFAVGFDGSGVLGDVSNNVRNAFEVTPWAIGQISLLMPGALVPVESKMTFDLNLSDPLVLSYVRAGLNAGSLDLFLTGLSLTAQMSASGIASFYTKDNLLHDVAFDPIAGRLSGDITAVPEPSVWALITVAGLVLVWRFRRARA